jgi:putative flippase GtrA
MVGGIMKELFSLIGKRDFKGLFYRKTDNIFIQFFRYCFVGGLATVAEGGALWLIQHFLFREAQGFWVFASQAIAFVIGLVVNFVLSKLFVFQEKSEKTNAAGEFLTYAVVGVVGLGIKELLLWLFHIQIGWHYMLVWVVSTIIVLVWNYAGRRLLLYRKKK